MPDPSSFNAFLCKFLASPIRELAVWMSEADCRTFGWPTNKQNGGQANFWSLNENGQKIRNEIRQRLSEEFYKNFIFIQIQVNSKDCVKFTSRKYELFGSI